MRGPAAFAAAHGVADVVLQVGDHLHQQRCGGHDEGGGHDVDRTDPRVAEAGPTSTGLIATSRGAGARRPPRPANEPGLTAMPGACTSALRGHLPPSNPCHSIGLLLPTASPQPGTHPTG